MCDFYKVFIFPPCKVWRAISRCLGGELFTQVHRLAMSPATTLAPPPPSPLLSRPPRRRRSTPPARVDLGVIVVIVVGSRQQGCIDRKWRWRSSARRQWWWGFRARPRVSDDVSSGDVVAWRGGAASMRGRRAHGRSYRRACWLRAFATVCVVVTSEGAFSPMHMRAGSRCLALAMVATVLMWPVATVGSGFPHPDMWWSRPMAACPWLVGRSRADDFARGGDTLGVVRSRTPDLGSDLGGGA